MTRDDLHLDPDPLYVEPEPVKPTRTGCFGLVLSLVAAVMLAALAAPWSGQPTAHPVAGLSGAPLAGVAQVQSTAVGAAQTDGSEVVGSDPALGGQRADGGAPQAARYRGTATFYCSDGRGGSPVSACTRGYGPDDLVAAIDRKDSEFRKGDRVLVRYGKRSVVVTIVDTCRCADRRVIDLTIGAFERLAPWGVGVLPVTLEAAGADQTLPPTDSKP